MDQADSQRRPHFAAGPPSPTARGGGPKRRSRGARSTATLLLAVSLLAGADARAERCDGPPNPAYFLSPSEVRTDDAETASLLAARPKWYRWRFCVIVTQNAAGNWTLAGDRKLRAIDIPPNHKADIVFLVDRDYASKASLAGVSIQRTEGTRAPGRAFVIKGRHDFARGRKIEFEQPVQRFQVGVRNYFAAEYSYEVFIVDGDGRRVRVDPRIRNRGRRN